MYECLECGKVPARASILKDHLNDHQNIKPFTCVQCQTRFTRKNELKTHQKEKHGRTSSYACPGCEKVFNRRTSLKRHLNGKTKAQCLLQTDLLVIDKDHRDNDAIISTAILVQRHESARGVKEALTPSDIKTFNRLTDVSWLLLPSRQGTFTGSDFISLQCPTVI